MIGRIGGVAGQAALFGMLLAALGSSPSPTLAQDQRLESLVNRLDRLERDIGMLNRQLSRGEAPRSGAVPNLSAPSSPPPSDYYGRVEARIQQLEGDLRSLTGNLETLTHQNSELKAQLERLQRDVELRLGDLEKGGAQRAAQPQATAGAQPPGASGSPGVLGTMPAERAGAAKGGAAKGGGEPPMRTAALPQGTPQQQYDYALGLLGKSDYDGAAQAFQEFLDKNPSSPLAANARYWLGETHYVRKDYNSAARVFLDGYTKDQKGPKAPDTLLKLGMSLTNLDKKKEACATFDKLAKDFPDAPQSIKQRIPPERKRAGCR